MRKIMRGFPCPISHKFSSGSRSSAWDACAQILQTLCLCPSYIATSTKEN